LYNEERLDLAERAGRSPDAGTTDADKHTPAFRQTDQARIDFDAIESDLQVIQKQLVRLPTRSELARTALGIIFATMVVTTLRLLFFLRWSNKGCVRPRGGPESLIFATRNRIGSVTSLRL